MTKISLIVLLLSAVAYSHVQQLKSPVDYVDPFIGSQGARWFAFTPAALPFGLVKLSPMTYGFNGYSGGGGRSGSDSGQAGPPAWLHRSRRADLNQT
jgi:hypothetical protein